LSKFGQGEIAEKKVLLANDPIALWRVRVDARYSHDIASLRAVRILGQEDAEGVSLGSS
jgi:hypothetical protein